MALVGVEPTNSSIIHWDELGSKESLSTIHYSTIKWGGNLLSKKFSRFFEVREVIAAQYLYLYLKDDENCFKCPELGLLFVKTLSKLNLNFEISNTKSGLWSTHVTTKFFFFPE